MATKDELYYKALDLLKNLISNPSISREEVKAADLIESVISSEDITSYRKGNNVWAISPQYNLSHPTILLNSHIDTVKPVAGWKKEPFMPVIEDGRLYGLGSNDAGASVVSLLSAFLYLIKTDQKYNLIFLASSEEEVSGKNGIESILPELPVIDFAIVGEPTGMAPAIAEKGLIVLDCSVYGTSGHAARNEGENAIYKALPIISALRDFSFPKISENLGSIKISVTQIQAGTQHNVIPDRCDFVVDIRTNDHYTNKEVVDILKKQIPCDITPRSLRLNSSRIELSHPFVQRAIIAGKQPFGSPTLSDQALMPFPSVKIGPGDSARSHTADEYIKLDEIREAIELYISLLDRLTLK